MPINKNATALSAIYKGSSSVAKAYLGTDQIFPNVQPFISYLVIAGGGGAGAYSGGGAGGYRSSYPLDTYSGGNSALESTLEFTSGVTYTATIGGGGTYYSGNSFSTCGVYNDNVPTKGSNSVLSGSGITTITSIGGGAGLNSSEAVGGSGGGGNSTGSTANQGFNGGNESTSAGGAGGGAGSVGGNGPNGLGGAGLASLITGSSVGRGGGGNGRSNATSQSFGGGYYAADCGGQAARSGDANTGGGGAGSWNSILAGSGGKGVIILRMPTAIYSGNVTGSPVVTTDGTDTIIQFNSTGTYTH